MERIDEAIAGLGGGSLILALAVAVLLGLRHATDPDHLTAVATLIVSDERHGTRRARRLGAAWGLGHAVTMFAFGVPVVLAGSTLPDSVQRAAELAIGVLIAGLAVRLLVRWQRGVFHVHPHEHQGVEHVHPHAHERDHAHGAPHGHRHADAVGRTARAAFGIGLVHGIGGSAGAGVLLVGAVAGGGTGVLALALFAAATAASMAVTSAVLGYGLARGSLMRRLEAVVPAFGTASLAFGAWYALGALAA
jgi:ABC-type nickel/cobalt efflux system permease component RcnA